MDEWKSFYKKLPFKARRFLNNHTKQITDFKYSGLEGCDDEVMLFKSSTTQVEVSFLMGYSGIEIVVWVPNNRLDYDAFQLHIPLKKTLPFLAFLCPEDKNYKISIERG